MLLKKTSKKPEIQPIKTDDTSQAIKASSIPRNKQKKKKWELKRISDRYSGFNILDLLADQKLRNKLCSICGEKLERDLGIKCNQCMARSHNECYRINQENEAICCYLKKVAKNKENLKIKCEPLENSRSLKSVPQQQISFISINNIQGFNSEYTKFKSMYSSYLVKDTEETFIKFPAPDSILINFDSLANLFSTKKFPEPVYINNYFGVLLQLWSIEKILNLQLKFGQSISLAELIQIFLDSSEFYRIVCPLLNFFAQELISERKMKDQMKMKIILLRMLDSSKKQKYMVFLLGHINVFLFVLQQVIQLTILMLLENCHSSDQQSQSEGEQNELTENKIKERRKILDVLKQIRKEHSSKRKYDLMTLQFKTTILQILISFIYEFPSLSKMIEKHKEYATEPDQIDKTNQPKKKSSSRFKYTLLQVQKFTEKEIITLKKKIQAEIVRLSYIQNFSEKDKDEKEKQLQQQNEVIKKLRVELQNKIKDLETHKNNLHPTEIKEQCKIVDPPMMKQSPKGQSVKKEQEVFEEKANERGYFLGKNRYGLHFYLFPDLSGELIVFDNEKNRWGYYGEKQIQLAIQCCNERGIHEFQLKRNLSLFLNCKTKQPGQRISEVLRLIESQNLEQKRNCLEYFRLIQKKKTPRRIELSQFLRNTQNPYQILSLLEIWRVINLLEASFYSIVLSLERRLMMFYIKQKDIQAEQLDTQEINGCWEYFYKVIAKQRKVYCRIFTRSNFNCWIKKYFLKFCKQAKYLASKFIDNESHGQQPVLLLLIFCLQTELLLDQLQKKETIKKNYCVKYFNQEIYRFQKGLEVDLMEIDEDDSSQGQDLEDFSSGNEL